MRACARTLLREAYAILEAYVRVPRVRMRDSGKAMS